jgi:NTP pyrophosphatase (non-canonical NTP hydrolase)
MYSYSNLTSQQEEIIRIMQEEAAEVIQVVSKICRFGIDSYTGRSNRDQLAAEIGDIVAMIDLAVEHGIVDRNAIVAAAARKREKLRFYSGIFQQ